MKKAIILGAKGYVGQHIVRFLNDNYNIETICYDVINIKEKHYKRVDITNKFELNKIDFGVDYIFFFAGLTGTWVGFDNYSEFVTVNEIGLLNLLDAIRKSPYRPKIIFPSSRLVYKGSDKPLTEEDEKETKTIYAANKLVSEGYLQSYFYSFEIPYTIFRICLPYGNLLSNNYSFGTVGFFINQAKAGNDITLYGGGNIKRTFTHMEDLCYQITEGAFQTESNGEIYNVGGEILSLREAAEIIANKYGTNVVAVPWPERDLRIETGHTYFDDSKIRSLIDIPPYKKLSDFSNDL